MIKSIDKIHDHWKNICIDFLQDKFQNWDDWCEVDFQDGNPIYSMHNLGTNKAFRIIHSEEEVDRYGMFLNKALDYDTMEDSINELVFTLPFDKCADNIFKIMFGIWIHPETDAAFMNKILSHMHRDRKNL